MFAMPGVRPEATPAKFTVATGLLSELHEAFKVTSCVDASLNVAVAMKGWLTPTGIVAVIGVTVIDWTVEVLTVSARLPATPL